jgi:hypothetical protein
VYESDIQTLLESSASELDAPITLEDLSFRLLAHTDHSGAIDEVRRSMIIGRHATPDVRSWFRERMRGLVGPIRTPADATLGVLERWGVPVRFRGTPLGHLWVLDAGRLSEAELAPVVGVADQIGALLYRRRLASQIDVDLLRLLLIPNRESENVLAEVRGLGAFPHRGPIAAIVAGSARSDDMAPDELGLLALAVERLAEESAPEPVLGGVISELGVILAPLRGYDDLSQAQRLAERICTISAQFSDDLEVLVAVGGPADLSDASRSYAEARRALLMMRAVPDLRPIVAWDELGVFRALALLPRDDRGSDVIDPRVRKLLDDDLLASTAETFLELAGSVQDTAKRLFVHRTTLYQRLDRIGALYDLDLRHSGDHRLITHLGLKLARIARS